MPAYKLRELGTVIRQALLQAWLEGNSNWIPDYRLAARIRGRFEVVCKDDDVRRVCSDLWHQRLIQKLSHKSLYKTL